MNGLINSADYDHFIQGVVAGMSTAGITYTAILGPFGELLESVRQPIVHRNLGNISIKWIMAGFLPF